MFEKLRNASTPLTITGIAMLAILVATVVGLVVDSRVVTGAPVWLKPAKFAVSIAIYTFTLAWVFTLIPEWTRTRRIVGGSTAIAMAVEMAIILLQAARGTSSHFNLSTPFDAVLFGIMGLIIVAQTLTSIAVAVALWRQPFVDRPLGWALRLGMTITIVGALSGGMMTRPTAAQLEAARAGHGMPRTGAHTVGADDGGSGMAGTGWSTDHGDLRVAHFVGLHALQALPIVALTLRRKRLAESARLRATLAAAASYAVFFVILVWQALRGQSVSAPDSVTTMTLVAWAGFTAVAVSLSLVRPAPAGRPVIV